MFFICVCPCAVFRNSLGCDKIFVHRSNKLYSFFKTIYEAGPGELPEVFSNYRSFLVLQTNVRAIQNSQYITTCIFTNLAVKYFFGSFFEFISPLQIKNCMIY